MTDEFSTLEDLARELSGRREAFVRALVVRAQHPTSARAGDRALVSDTGEINGFVGGNCVQASVREYSLRALADGEPVLLRVSPGEPSREQQDGAVDVSNPCLSGGAIEIFLEPQLPAPRVVVVGSTPVALAVLRLGAGLGFELAHTDGDAVPTQAGDAALIVASHGTAEEPALEAALHAGIPYVGLVASGKRAAAVLASLDVTDAERSRVHSPAGLPIGARTPAEIALSILAELVAERSGSPALEPGAAGESSVGSAPIEPPRREAPATATDPVCGMSVAAVPATLHADHDGVRIYFCAAGCRTAFLADPERYAVPS